MSTRPSTRIKAWSSASAARHRLRKRTTRPGFAYHFASTGLQVRHCFTTTYAVAAGANAAIEAGTPLQTITKAGLALDEKVSTAATGQLVSLGLTLKVIAPRTAGEGVLSRPAHQKIISGKPQYRVAALASV